MVAIDYFTKFIEAVSLKNISHEKIIEFITEHIVHRFGIPQTFTTDQETSFVSRDEWDFTELYMIKLLNPSLYYAQTNG